LDSNIVSNENLTEILPSSGWALGKVTWAKVVKNLPHLWRHSQKNGKPKPKIFFIAESKTYRVFRGFEQLSSTIGWGAMQLVRLLKYARF